MIAYTWYFNIILLQNILINLIFKFSEVLSKLSNIDRYIYLSITVSILYIPDHTQYLNTASLPIVKERWSYDFTGAVVRVKLDVGLLWIPQDFACTLRFRHVPALPARQLCNPYVYLYLKHTCPSTWPSRHLPLHSSPLPHLSTPTHAYTVRLQGNRHPLPNNELMSCNNTEPLITKYIIWENTSIPIHIHTVIMWLICHNIFQLNISHLSTSTFVWLFNVLLNGVIKYYYGVWIRFQ